ncbi:hypothetical protein ACYPKM_04780 [Pseudomonas aeruginosa]
MTERVKWEINAESVRKLRDFTGEGMMAVRKALVGAEGDPLLAVGHLRACGCLVNASNPEAWFNGYAQSIADELELDEGGNIRWKAAKTFEAPLQNMKRHDPEPGL